VTTTAFAFNDFMPPSYANIATLPKPRRLAPEIRLSQVVCRLVLKYEAPDASTSHQSIEPENTPRERVSVGRLFQNQRLDLQKWP